MKTFTIIFTALGLLTIMPCGQSAFAQNTYSLKVELIGLESDSGKIMFQLFNSDQKVIKEQYVKIKNKKAELVIENLEKGQYAVRVYHDENNNDKLDYNFFGAPDEGYGYSNNAKGQWGPPKFEDQLFAINKNTTIQITLTH